MINLKEFIKTELKGWKKQEIIGLSIVFVIVFVNALLVKDNIIAVISAVCGILYTIIAGKGKISCYLFGITSTFCYSWLSYDNGLWGNLFLNMCYYLPMQIAGIFEWKKHLKKETKEIIKTTLTLKERIIFCLIAAAACTAAILLLYHLHDSSPVCDGITTVLSILGMYLTVKRCIEQWILWMIVNGLSMIMWFILIMHGTKTYSTFIMWNVYFILAIYFYIQWSKEIKKTGTSK